MKFPDRDVLLLATQSAPAALRGTCYCCFDLQTPDSWRRHLPRRPRILVHCEGEGGSLKPLLEHLRRDGCKIHLILATPPPFSKHGALESGRLSSWFYMARSVTLLDGAQLLLRLPESATIQQFFALQAQYVAGIVSDVVWLLTLSHRPRMVRAFRGIFLWDRTRISPLPAWQHCATSVRWRDGQLPALAVLYTSDSPVRVERLCQRLDARGVLTLVFPKRSGTRV